MSDFITNYPYGAVVAIADVIGGETYEASGVLIAPDEVLTAGTALYDAKAGTATGFIVAAGYNGTNTGFEPETLSTVHDNATDASAGGLTSQQAALDFGLIHLQTPQIYATGYYSSRAVAGYMGLGAGFAGGTVNIAGYPDSSGGFQYQGSETVTPIASTNVFSGAVFDDAADGSPIWINSASGPQVVGLYTGPLGSGSGGYVQLTAADITEIDGWIQQDDPGYQLPSAQVSQMFTNILGRAADPGGLNYWVSQLEQTGSATRVETYLETSSEGQAALATTYQNVLGRNLDAGGQAYFSTILSNGDSLAHVAGILATSKEGQTDLSAIYQNVLGRGPDAGGDAFFTQYLSSGGSLTGVRAILADSAEGQQDIANAYQDILGRAPDAGGQTFFTQTLLEGSTIADVRSTIASSSESNGRVAALIQQDFRTAPTVAQISAAELQLSRGMNFTDLTTQTALLALNPAVTQSSGNALNGVPEIFDWGSNNYNEQFVQIFNPKNDIIEFNQSQFSNFSDIVSSETIFDRDTVIIDKNYVYGANPGSYFTISTGASVQSSPPPLTLTNANFRFV